MDPYLGGHGYWTTQERWLRCNPRDCGLILERNYPHRMHHRVDVRRMGKDFV